MSYPPQRRMAGRVKETAPQSSSLSGLADEFKLFRSNNVNVTIYHNYQILYFYSPETEILHWIGDMRKRNICKESETKSSNIGSVMFNICFNVFNLFPFNREHFNTVTGIDTWIDMMWPAAAAAVARFMEGSAMWCLHESCNVKQSFLADLLHQMQFIRLSSALKATELAQTSLKQWNDSSELVIGVEIKFNLQWINMTNTS